MNCTPAASGFKGALPISTLVLVDMRNGHLPPGLKSSHASTVVQNCRRALQLARRYGLRVAHMRSAGMPELGSTISGFEPDRMDTVFERSALSCYSSPYFQSVMREAAGSYVLAGFLGDGGALATIADAIRCGDYATLLTDALQDNMSGRVFTDHVLSFLTKQTTLRFDAITTSAWLQAVESHVIVPPVPPPNAAKRTKRMRHQTTSKDLGL